jgi:peptidoglycan-associated lipoprotein
MKIRSSALFIIILMVSTLAFWGCPKKTEVTATPEAQQETAPSAEELARAEQEKAEAARRAAEAEAEAKARAEAEERERAAAEASKGLQPVYFDFDKSFIRGDMRDVMKQNAEWMKSHPDAKIKVEGNCDERGTIEYNQALGQRRAAAAKKYLTDLGIKAGRISLISYGKEKPVCTESTEECWQKNRRSDFVAE